MADSNVSKTHRELVAADENGPYTHPRACLPRAISSRGRKRSWPWPLPKRSPWKLTGTAGKIKRSSATIPSAVQCSPSTGRRTSGHGLLRFGKAMTSRIDSAPVMIITSRSRPNASPPCGGAPYSRASIGSMTFRLHGVFSLKEKRGYSQVHDCEDLEQFQRIHR